MPDKDAWVIRDVDEETRRKIKRFAVDNSLTIAGALRVLVTMALGQLDDVEENSGVIYLPNKSLTARQVKQASLIELSPEMLKTISEEVTRQILEHDDRKRAQESEGG